MRYLTPDGLRKLQEKINDLKQKRDALIRRRAEAYVMGGDGWHDNPEFESIEAEDKRLSSELFRLQEELAQSEVAVQPSVLMVAIGSKVEIEFSDGVRKIFEIGDSHNANPADGIISFISPLGKALLGGTANQARTYLVAQKTITVKIISIS